MPSGTLGQRLLFLMKKGGRIRSPHPQSPAQSPGVTQPRRGSFSGRDKGRCAAWHHGRASPLDRCRARPLWRWTCSIIGVRRDDEPFATS